MANTYVKLGSYTAPFGGGNNISFNNIPQTYTDLEVHISARGASANTYDSIGIYFNGLQSSQTQQSFTGNGTSMSAGTSTYRAIATITAANSTGAAFSNVVINIHNYAGSTNKSLFIMSAQEQTSTSSNNILATMLWSNTAAITSLTFDTATTGQNYAQYSTFTLYAIKNQ